MLDVIRVKAVPAFVFGDFIFSTIFHCVDVDCVLLFFTLMVENVNLSQHRRKYFSDMKINKYKLFNHSF